MNPPLPSTPPTIKGAIGAAGKEIANVGQGTAKLYTNATKGLQNVGSQIRSNVQGAQSNPNSSKANYSINPLQGTGTAFRSAFKKANKR